MKHVSMVPPQTEPAYRVRLEQRKVRWDQLERVAAIIAVREAQQEAASTYYRSNSNRYLSGNA